MYLLIRAYNLSYLDHIWLFTSKSALRVALTNWIMTHCLRELLQDATLKTTQEQWLISNCEDIPDAVLVSLRLDVVLQQKSWPSQAIKILTPQIDPTNI